MNRQNEIHRLDKITTDRKNYKPIFIIFLILLIGAILLLILFKDSFKLNSINTFEESNELIYDKNIEINFDTININSDFSNIYIEKTDNDYATINIYGEKTKAVVNKEDNDLNINLKLTCTICHDVKSGKIIIGIPEDKIDSINIENEYGSLVSDDFDFDMLADIEYGNFSASSLDTLNLSLTSGNIKISEISNANINVDIGNVTINTVNNSSNISAGLGNVIITDMLVQKKSLIYAENGSIVIVNADDYYYNAKSVNGIIELPDENDENGVEITLITETGNITVGK